MRNPLSRLISILGLIMLGAIAYQVAIGELQLPEGAIRAAITLGAVILLRRLGRFGMGLVADSMERQAASAGRRRDDT